MRNVWNRKGLGGSEFLTYGGAAAAIAFIFAMTLGAMDGPDGSNRTAANTSRLVAESSP